MKEVQLRNMVLLGNTLSKLYAHCLQNRRKIQLQNLRQGFDAVAAEANRNVFKKPTNTKKAETNNKKAAEATKTAIKNQMSTVREEEDEEYSPGKTKGIINLNVLSKKANFNKFLKPMTQSIL